MLSLPVAQPTCYTVAFTLRSGSNLLCDYLKENGLGQPNEYFQYPYGVANKPWYDDMQIPLDNFPLFMQTLLIQKAQNSVFGTKLTWDHKNVLIAEVQKLGFSVASLSDIFPENKIVYVYRRDKISQVISLWRAAQTNNWTSLDQNETILPEYDFFKILSHFQTILTEDYLWTAYLDGCAFPIIRIAYEDFIAQPRETIRDIHQYILQLDSPLPLADIKIPDRLRMQRDSFSGEIKQRFLDDLSHIGVEDHWETRALQLKQWSNFFGQSQWK